MRAIIIVLLLTAASTATAQTRVYQWTDSDGVVHFSTEPPPDPDQQVESRMIDETPRPGSVATAPPPAPEAPAEPGNANPPPDPREEARLRAERCEQWRQIVATMEPAQRVRKTEADGTVTYLSGDERIEELERARRMVTENCS